MARSPPQQRRSDHDVPAAAQSAGALARSAGRRIAWPASSESLLRLAAGLQRGKANRARLSATDLRQAQRVLGNRAVQGLLARQADGQLMIDRQEAPTGAAPGDEAGAGLGVGAGVGASACGVPAGCPAEFCTPFSSRFEALAIRTASAPVLLAGIAAKVDSRVVPLWSQYLFGGAGVQSLDATFGPDFSRSATTAATTDFLVEALRQDIEARPPVIPVGGSITVDIPSRIGTAISAIGDPASTDAMDFNVIGEIPGNIAGGIGRDQTSCPVGATPSPIDDSRTAAGTADVRHNPDGSLTITPNLIFTVQDTIDLCPGNCGAAIEQIATVPMSRMEASGVSGDVPFTVQFAAPPRSVVARPVVPPVPPVPTPAAPLRGRVTASALNIRQAPSTAAPILGQFARDTEIQIECAVDGTPVAGNATWLRTSSGFVSQHFVRLLDVTPVPRC